MWMLSGNMKTASNHVNVLTSCRRQCVQDISCQVSLCTLRKNAKCGSSFCSKTHNFACENLPDSILLEYAAGLPVLSIHVTLMTLT